MRTVSEEYGLKSVHVEAEAPRDAYAALKGRPRPRKFNVHARVVCEIDYTGLEHLVVVHDRSRVFLEKMSLERRYPAGGKRSTERVAQCALDGLARRSH